MNDRKITFSIDNENLHVTSSNGEVPDLFINFLKQHKQEIIQAFQPKCKVSSTSEQIVRKELAKIWFKLTGVEPEENSVFLNLGNSSMDIVRLRKKIFNQFNIELSVTQLFKNKLFSEQVDLIQTIMAKTLESSRVAESE